MSGKRDFVVRRAGPDDAGRRLDRVLRNYLRDLPLSAIYGALRRGRVLVNGRAAEGSLRVVEGDLISLDSGLAAAVAGGEPQEGAAPKAESGLPALGELLIYSSRDLLFLNKPRGMLVQGDDSLETLVRAALVDRGAVSLSFRPGPLHRLDRNTSGLVAFPRSAAGAREFSALLRERKVEKRYLALLEGELAAEEAWSDRLERDSALRASSVGEEGKAAQSFARPLLAVRGLTLALVLLGTGLTHQIRVQAAARGHPLAGDRKYGGRPFAGGYILHALSLRFPEPPFPDLRSLIVAPLPPEALGRLEGLFGREALAGALASALGPALGSTMENRGTP